MNNLDTKYKNSLVVLRLLMGILMLWSGMQKLLEGFSAAGYLLNATSGPFADLFQALAGSPVVDFLVVFGELGIGIALIFGVATRLGAVSGAIMMLFFYLSSLPPEHGPINEHIIYITVFLVLGLFGVGRYLGIDRILEKYSFVQKNYKYFRYVLA